MSVTLNVISGLALRISSIMGNAALHPNDNKGLLHSSKDICALSINMLCVRCSIEAFAGAALVCDFSSFALDNLCFCALNEVGKPGFYLIGYAHHVNSEACSALGWRAVTVGFP